ncbi:hypothetical protein [Alkalilimnicola ehrlichii]|uniref:hypothetical protein n=1 Tax=Alkalilimnicola ehrlichii TaxID=351052 RepID=UPI001C6DFF0D|nr:hypothetical protein [Alkalilimnicola ehrlichii]
MPILVLVRLSLCRRDPRVNGDVRGIEPWSLTVQIELQLDFRPEIKQWVEPP